MQPPTRTPTRTLWVILSLAVGVTLWLTIGHRSGLNVGSVFVLAAATLAAAIPAWRDPLLGVLDRIHLSSRQRRWTMLAVFLIAAAYLLLTALFQDRDMIPKFHDEHMHLLQARMLAHGRLWMPAHPLGEFFDSFHIIVKPVYASIYFPGASLLLVPAIWLGLPFWVTPLIVAAASAALIYRVTSELIDDVAGILAALLLISLDTFRFLSMVAMSHGVMLFFGLLIVWAYLHWRKHPGIARAALIGALAGWAAIIRPLDALAYALPVGAAMLLDMRHLAPRRNAAHIAVIVAAAIPFLSLQLILNFGLTGHALHLPNELLRPGFESADATTQSTLPQKQDMYREFFQPQFQRHREQSIARSWLTDRIPMIVQTTLPNALVLILLPLGLFGMARNRRWVLAAMLPLYVLAYATFPFMLRQYALIAAPAMIVLVLSARQAITHRAANLALTLALVGLAIIALPEIDRDKIDDGYVRPSMWFVAKEMPKIVKPPAIVLFRYQQGDEFHEEPVYNIDATNPDAAPIIRAHDLGKEKDLELFKYYASRQPQRTVYLYDRATRRLVQIGNVAALAEQLGH